MIFVSAILVSLIFVILSAIHVYWGMNGRWGIRSVIPTKDDAQPVKIPGSGASFVVAILLFIPVLLIVAKTLFKAFLPSLLNDYGLYVVGTVFLLRAIGEFNYVGFFKRIRNTHFAQMDTYYFSPLCAFIGVMLFILEEMI